jgi:hypothetical protein
MGPFSPEIIGLGLLGKSRHISSSDNAIGALRIQTSTQGLPIALVYGMTRISPNLVEYIDFRAIPHTTSQDVGGKGGGTTVSSTTYTYEVAVIFGLGEGRMQVERIWKNKEETSIGGLGFELFDGSASQPPWSYMANRYDARPQPFGLNLHGSAIPASQCRRE